ncbi:haloalkane dehalogenase [Capsulimonas corticalis]|uniref:Haloalkane dehalogenase n=1 Tax=Capsulimonas corticalis TaxID=2219043 RepID=A0A402CSH1_9BACT|nr:alpha/beta fold hydrolase [Capsulimonas corticalis]BDI31093.1 haloalkane dehalogenase [Capsulimonas corticalis]
MSPQSTPTWLDRTSYPFESRFFTTRYGEMHYVDEGAGDVVLFVHGNPTWSYEHRRLIAHLRTKYRCVAVDHLGFGLSDKPADVSYLPQFHAENLACFIDALGLKNITLIVHDWGGPIGMSYALDHPANIKRIIAYNSWFWSLRGDATFEKFSGFVGGPIGRFLCRNFNFFPRVLLPASVGDKNKLTPDIHRHFIRAFPTPQSRKGAWTFPRAIIGQSEWLETLWTKREALKDTPLLLLWGLKDVAFTKDLMARWESAFPHHTTRTFPNVGHFAPEEIGGDAIEPVEAFFKANP